MLVKLLLISVQMILVTYLGEKAEPITDDNMIFDESGPDLLDYIRHVHVDRPSYWQLLEEQQEES
jgi:hypothetical protein